MNVTRADRRPSLRKLLPPPPAPAKPGPLDTALTQRLKATVDRVRREAEQAATEFLGAEPTDSARPYGKAGSIKVQDAKDAAAATET